MAQFDCYRFGRGFLLDVQADLMSGLNTRIVVPLMLPEEAPVPGRWLNPVFAIDDAPFVMVTQYMASVPVANLGEKACSLAEHRYAIKGAIDMLVDGV